GVGVAAVDEHADAATLAGLIVGPLLMGNGVVVAARGRMQEIAEPLVQALRGAGVPQASLALASSMVGPVALAAGPVHFAAVDLSLEDTRAVNVALSTTDEASGQRWIKALIAMGDGVRPGEPGFLRQFARPKTVAIQTLRHGAELGLG
ncbi:MAG: hypothetical protein V3S98_07425, partial [Dehalococcoidia bacterium]